jgi:hypothetical protein
MAWIRSNLTRMVVLRRARWLGALLIAPVLVFAVAASTYLGLRCRVTGMIALDSCCPQAAEEASSDSTFPEQATVGDAGCCDRLVVTVSKIPGATSERGLEISARPVTAIVAPPERIDLPSLLSVGWTRRTAQPPGVAPPAFLLRHSFLI